MKLTPWYPPEVKPIRVGVYEVVPISAKWMQMYCYWNGQRWGGAAGYTPERAVLFKDVYDPSYQRRTWRGVKR